MVTLSVLTVMLLLFLSCACVAVLQVNQKLQLIGQGKWVDEEPEQRRSPSPEPLYNEQGARTNTREQRAKDKLLRQRNVSVCWQCAVGSVHLSRAGPQAVAACRHSRLQSYSGSRLSCQQCARFWHVRQSKWQVAKAFTAAGRQHRACAAPQHQRFAPLAPRK